MNKIVVLYRPNRNKKNSQPYVFSFLLIKPKRTN